MTSLNVLILGASFGSLLATKISMAGHNATMVCLPVEAELFNNDGAIIRTPVKGRDGLVEIRSKTLTGKIAACAPADADPANFDLAVLAMQEPQYSAPEVNALLQKIAKSRVPTMSIMNMPPLAFLRRVSGLDIDGLRSCYANSTVWDAFDIDKFTLCSPDPQAFRPPEETLNVLDIALKYSGAGKPKSEGIVMPIPIVGVYSELPLRGDTKLYFESNFFAFKTGKTSYKHTDTSFGITKKIGQALEFTVGFKNLIYRISNSGGSANIQLDIKQNTPFVGITLIFNP